MIVLKTWYSPAAECYRIDLGDQLLTFDSADQVVDYFTMRRPPIAARVVDMGSPERLRDLQNRLASAKIEIRY